MTSYNEMIDIIQHYNNGRVIKRRKIGKTKWKELKFNKDPNWNWTKYSYVVCNEIKQVFVIFGNNNIHTYLSIGEAMEEGFHRANINTFRLLKEDN